LTAISVDGKEDREVAGMTDPQNPESAQRIAGWRYVLAFIIDLILAFAVIGYVVAALTGNLTSGGFNMEGGPALVTFALIIAYFVLGGRFGFRLGDRLFGIRRRRQS
jgi:hypothetical protein